MPLPPPPLILFRFFFLSSAFDFHAPYAADDAIAADAALRRFLMRSRHAAMIIYFFLFADASECCQLLFSIYAF